MDDWMAEARSCLRAGDLQGAARALARALESRPDAPAPHRLAYANVLLDLGDAPAAEAQAREALRGAGDWAPALNLLGLALGAQGRHSEARDAFEAAVQAEPGHRFALANLARAYDREVRLEEAIATFRRALAADDGNADLWCELGNAAANAGQQREASAAYRAALERDPGYHQVESNLLIQMHYDPAVDPAQLSAAHGEWARRHAPHAPPPPPPRGHADGPRRLAFLSPRLHDGPTGTFLLPLLENIDRSRFEIHLFDVGGVRDRTSERLEALGEWHAASTDSDTELALRIRDCGIDILVDLAGHAPGGRLRALALRPAPVIAAWLDYFNTTGLPAVDFILGDPVSTPRESWPLFSERVLTLEPCRFCYGPPDFAPEVVPPPALANGFMTFGSFNRLSKLAPATLDLWARTVLAVPDSRLVLKARAFVDRGTRSRIEREFAARGLPAQRVELRADSGHREMLGEYGDLDIALDPFPYNGGLTTCEALWMGVPVLALAGNSMISRQSASLLEAAGLPQWVARDGADFIERAKGFGCDPQGLAELRKGMRAGLRRSALLDAASFARSFERALGEMEQKGAGTPN